MKYTNKCEMILSTNPINLLWCLLSAMVSGMATFSFLQPFWLIDAQSPHYLGIYSSCIRDSKYISQDIQICGIYGGHFSLHNLPSLEWRITCLLFGGGCLLHLLCATLAMSLFCMWPSIRRKAACVIGFLQAIAVIFSVVGLLLFPMGFNSRYVKHYCSLESQRFYAGKCEIGWGMLLAIMGTSLSIFCPILAQFYDVWVCEKLPPSYWRSNTDVMIDDEAGTIAVISGQESFSPNSMETYTEMFNPSLSPTESHRIPYPMANNQNGCDYTRLPGFLANPQLRNILQNNRCGMSTTSTTHTTHTNQSNSPFLSPMGTPTGTFASSNSPQYP